MQLSSPQVVLQLLTIVTFVLQLSPLVQRGDRSLILIVPFVVLQGEALRLRVDRARSVAIAYCGRIYKGATSCIGPYPSGSQVQLS